MTGLRAGAEERILTRDTGMMAPLHPPRAQGMLDALTTLRFLAAFRVMMFHIVNWETKGFALRALMGAPLGVSYFFLSSGFLLTYVHSASAARGTFDARRFWVKRAVRILPVYYLGLVVALPLLIGNGDVTVGKSLETVFLLHAWFAGGALYWNYPAWALSALAFFYAIFPGLLMATRMTSRRALWLLGGIAWVATLVPG